MKMNACPNNPTNVTMQQQHAMASHQSPPHQAERYVRIKLTAYQQIEDHMNSMKSRLKAYANLQTQLHEKDIELARYKKLANEYKKNYDQILQTQQRGISGHGSPTYGGGNYGEQVNGVGGRQTQPTPPHTAQYQGIVSSPGHVSQHLEDGHDHLQRQAMYMQPFTQAPPVLTTSNGISQAVGSPGHPQQQQQQHMIPQQDQQQIQTLFRVPNNAQPSESEDMENTSLGLDFSLTSSNFQSHGQGMEDLLETLAQPQDRIPQFPVADWGNHYTSIAVDGEKSLESVKQSDHDDVSVKNLTSPLKKEKKTINLPTLPKNVFNLIVQNNVRLQRHLSDMVSRDSKLTPTEYEAIIAQLSSHVNEAENRYKSLRVSLRDCEDDPMKLEEKIADYETQINELRNVLTLKQSLLKFYTNEDMSLGEDTGDQDPQDQAPKPKSVEAEVQTNADIDDIALSLEKTKIEDMNLREAIENHEEELKRLEEQKALMEKDLKDKTAALGSIKRGMEAQAQVLKDTVDAVVSQERKSQHLRHTCKEYERKLSDIKREIESQGTASVESEEKTLYLTQLKQYEEDYRKSIGDLKMMQQRSKQVESHNKRLADENDKLQIMLRQKEQELESVRSPLRRPNDLKQEPRSTRCKDYETPWTQHQYHQHPQVTPDGPPSSLSLGCLRSSPSPRGSPDHHRAGSLPSLYREAAGSPGPGAYFRGGELATRECPRCYRPFSDIEDYNIHVKKCID